MTRYEFGDVLLVPFPFTDLSTTKRRPAVVISSEGFHREQANVIAMAVSSAKRQPGGVGTAVIDDWKAAGLVAPSVIRPMVMTISITLVNKRLGRLGPNDQAALRTAMSETFG